MSAYVNNNSKNIANILRQNQTDEASNKLRLRKPQKNYSKQVGSILGQLSATEQKLPQRPESQQYPKINNVNLQEEPENMFKISKKRRETPQSYDDNLELPQITGSNTLISQIQGLQRLIQTQIKRNRKNNEQIQYTKMKLDENTRYFQEKQSYVENKVFSRISELENILNRQRQAKYEVQQKIGTAEMSQKEIVNIIKNLQDQYSNDILAVKSLVQEKRSDEQQLYAKEKQKSTALFLEVVRLGDSLQKASETIGNISANFETRVQYLEGKLNSSQKNLMTLAQRNVSGNDMINELGDKLIKRLQDVETNLLILGKQQLKDKQMVNKLDSSTNRIAQDLNSLLRNVTNDFQSRLENRVTDIVNKLVSEKQERLRSQQEIKKALDARDRFFNEKQNNEKQSQQQRYQSMDSKIIKNEFVRKDESIRAIQETLQSQYKQISKMMEKQEKEKQNYENSIESQLKRIQQNFRKEYDIYKIHQTDLVEKITQMIKIEINTRLSSDVDLKNLTSAIGNDLANDLNNLKQAFSNSTKKINNALKQIKTENSERAAQLSHYTDEQVRKVVEVVSDKYNKMKNVFTKLTQQFRNHLISTQNNRKNFDVRITSNERDFETLKNQVNSVIDEFYKQLETRLKEQKQSIQTFTFKKQNQNTIRLNKLEEYVNQHFEVIKEGLQGNKQIMNSKLNNFSTQNGRVADTTGQDYKEMVQAVHKIRDLAENIQEQSQEQIKQLKKIIQQNNEATREQVLNIRTDLINKTSQNSKNISELSQSLTTNCSKLTNDLNTLKIEVETNRDINNDNMKKINQDINGAYKNLTELETIMKKQQEVNEQEIMKNRNELTILQTEIKTSDKSVHEDITKLIQITEMLKQKL